MALIATDWTVTRTTGNIRYIGDDHGGGAPSYATVIEFHRWLQGLADDAVAVGDDQLDITNTDPSRRSTDNIITLINGYNITPVEAEHLFDGSVIQGGGTDIWDGIVNFGNAAVQIQLIQNGAVLTDDWWNFAGGGLNADAASGISHRFMIKTRTAGTDIDNRRIVGTARRFGFTYQEFKINATARGNNVLALADSTDLNNQTAQGTVGAWDDIYIDRSTSSATVDGVNSTGQAVLNVSDGTQFTDGDFIMVEGDLAEYKIVSIATNALTLNRNLVVATTGGEGLYDLNIGFRQIDVNNNGSPEDYYAVWDRGGKTINQFYEYTKSLAREGSTDYIYGIPGELFRGITHEITVNSPTGTFDAVENVTWTGGSGQMLAINSPTAATKMWIQLLTGVAPTNTQVITGTNSTATATVNVTVTERAISTPYSGQSTGSALIGSYGLALQTTDLSSSDKLTDLGNNPISPPNNVTNTVSGLASGEDRVLVAPWDGTTTDSNGDPAITKDQLSLTGPVTTDDITSITVQEAIPSDTPASGYIRVTDDNGFERRLHYTQWTGSIFTIDTTDGNEDFNTVNAANGNDVYIAYIDEQAVGTTAAFTSVQTGTRNLVAIVRDGGGTPIKQFISSWTQTSTNQTLSAIRTTDV
jgi:hypothetical protein